MRHFFLAMFGAATLLLGFASLSAAREDPLFSPRLLSFDTVEAAVADDRDVHRAEARRYFGGLRETPARLWREVPFYYALWIFDDGLEARFGLSVEDAYVDRDVRVSRARLEGGETIIVIASENGKITIKHDADGNATTLRLDDHEARLALFARNFTMDVRGLIALAGTNTDVGAIDLEELDPETAVLQEANWMLGGWAPAPEADEAILDEAPRDEDAR